MVMLFGSGWKARSSLLCGLLISASACARGAPDAAVATGARNLHCARTELDSVLNRETSKVREYVVACNFMYTRVHCTDAGCHPAAVQPPCLGQKDCFEEDPVTLEWKPPTELGHRTAAR